jgi:hypothetical protein
MKLFLVSEQEKKDQPGWVGALHDVDHNFFSDGQGYFSVCLHLDRVCGSLASIWGGLWLAMAETKMRPAQTGQLPVPRSSSSVCVSLRHNTE